MTDWKPKGRSVVSPYIIVKDADKVIEFAKTVFDATVLRTPLRHSDGRLWNAELDINGSTIMIGDGGGDMTFTAFLHVYVQDVDATFKKAIAAGGSEMMPVSDQFYGDRSGGVADPCGNTWWIATLQKEMTDEELEAAKCVEEARRAGA